nr:histidine kinase [Kibdelosporangium sp. MJ126-NF4]
MAALWPAASHGGRRLRRISLFALSLLSGLGAALAGWLPHPEQIPFSKRHKESGGEPDDPAGDRCGGSHTGDPCDHQVHLARVLRDLHDEVGSSLAGVTAQLELVRRLLQSDIERAGRMVGEAHIVTTDLVATVRRISAEQRRACDNGRRRGPRPIGANRSAAFDDALRNMIGRMCSVVGDRLEITLDLGDGLDRVPGEAGWAAFWIVNEALTNVLRHSYADRCLVSVWVGDEDLHVQVQDNGVGLVTRVRTRRALKSGGSGVGNMADRAAELGGWCTVQPAIPSGAVALAALPLAGTRRGRAARSA